VIGNGGFLTFFSSSVQLTKTRSLLSYVCRQLDPTEPACAAAAAVNKQQRRCESVQSAETSPLLAAIKTAEALSYLVGDAIRSSATNPRALDFANAAAQILDHWLERLWKIIDASVEYRNDLQVLDALSDIDDVKHLAGVQIRALLDSKFAEVVGLRDVNWIAANCHGNVAVWQHLAQRRGVKIRHAPKTVLLDKEIMKTGCCTNPKWATSLPPLLLQDVELVRYLLVHSPAVVCYFSPKVFQPDGALHWTAGNEVVHWAFFHCCSNDPMRAKQWIDYLLECSPTLLCHLPVHWAFASFILCCSYAPKWAKRWIEKLPQALVENESFIYCLLECSPAVLCHIPAGAFQPGRPLYWTPTVDNKRVQRAFRQYFHSKESSSLRNGKLGAKLPRKFWDDRTFLCSWLEWGAGLGGIDRDGGIDVTEYGFLRGTRAFHILQEQEREFMESKDAIKSRKVQDAMARNCWYLLFQNCAKKRWVRSTFEAYASADIKSDKTKMLEIVKLRPHLLLSADETLQLHVDLLAAAVSVFPNIFAESDMGNLGGKQQDGQDNLRAITILLEGIRIKSEAVAFVEVAIKRRLPRTVWRHYSDCKNKSVYATAAAHLGRYLQGDDAARLKNYHDVLTSFLQGNRDVATSEVRTINEEETGDDQSNESSETDDDSDGESAWGAY
jgi:hypothetical protein